MSLREWRMGEKLVHAGRPEWGIGEVRGAQGVVEDGRPCQRLTIRFDRAGVKTLSTLFADLRAASDGLPANGNGTVEAAGESDDPASLGDRLTRLPDLATDPFTSKRTRLENSLGLYRFNNTGSSLLDWAAMQTGLADPLSRFNRHELEQSFEKFRSNLESHLKKLVSELRREDAAGLAAAIAACPPSAKPVLRRIDALR